MKIDIDKEIKKAQSQLDDCIESLSVLDNAVECGFLFDKHSLEMQKWIKEYKEGLEMLEIHLNEMITHG